jgi:hypothetical protein
MFHIKRRDSGSIPVEGSSKNITDGFPLIIYLPNVAITKESFLLLPPDKSFDYTSI